MSVSFTTKYLSLIELIQAARDAGDTPVERLAPEELLSAYTRLGERQTGTVESPPWPAPRSSEFATSLDEFGPMP